MLITSAVLCNTAKIQYVDNLTYILTYMSTCGLYLVDHANFMM